MLGPHKAAAVAAAIQGPVTTHCPASVLRTRAGSTLHMDRDAASKLDDVLNKSWGESAFPDP